MSKVPRGLTARGIRDAFEHEAGDVKSCELDGKGNALIRFFHPDDAEKAAEIFDMGELDGKVIYVDVIPERD